MIDTTHISVLLRHRRGLAATTLMAATVAVLSVVRSAPVVPSISELRLKTLQRVIEEVTAGLSSEGVIRARKRVIDRFHQLSPKCELSPTTPPIDEAACLQAARRTADKAMKAIYPAFDGKKSELEAAKKFPAYKVGDVVTVVYQASPVRQVKISGLYRGGAPGFIVIGGSRVLLKDIASVPGGAETVAKFDKEACERLRQEYIEKKKQEYNEERKTAWKHAFDRAIAEERRLARLQNELHGYIRYKEQWRRVQDVVSDLLSVESQRRLALDAAKPKPAPPIEPTPASVSAESVNPEPNGAATGAAVKPGGSAVEKTEEAIASAPNPVTDTGKEGTPGKSMEEKKVAPAVETVAAPGEESAKTGGTGKTGTLPKSEGAEEPSPTNAGENVSVPAATEGTPAGGATETAIGNGSAGAGKAFPSMNTVLSGAVSLVVFGIILVLVLSGFRGRSRGVFYTSKEAAEAEFWSVAETDEDQWKHVAFRFPNRDVAVSALSSLSYLSSGSKPGRFTCGSALHFGLYPEGPRYVAFVGGPSLSLSMWREAVTKWSESAHAEQFRVSGPPAATAAIPDLATLGGKVLEVTSVGEREGTGGDYSHYILFRAPDRESAMAFLRKVVVSALGEYVIVETPEGHWGKDCRGVYRE